jgi:hypothetical protein
MKFPLSTSVATVRSAPLLLIDLETEEGITGRTYLFCYRPSVHGRSTSCCGMRSRWSRGSPLRPSTQMSSHLLPETSVHLLAATPTCHYLEYVDWADAILEEPLQIQDGLARVPDRPGIGLTWRSEAVKALSLDR